MKYRKAAFGYQRIHHFLSRPVFSQKLVSRCPGGAAVLAPEIQIPLEARTEFGVARLVGRIRAGISTGSTGSCCHPLSQRLEGYSFARAIPACALSLQDASRSDPHIVVLQRAVRISVFAVRY